MVNKVVLSPSVDGHTELRITQIGPTLGERPAAGTELHLGSQDLIRFAAYSSGRGFSVSSFMLADAYLVQLDPEEQTQTSVQMVSLLSRFGEDELEAAMRDEFDGIYVVGVNLVSVTTGRRISVRRRGYIETSVVQEAEQLLKSAWRELRLS